MSDPEFKPKSEMAWFTLTWAEGPVIIDGPFGDDRAAAFEYAVGKAGEGERALVRLLIEPV